MRSMRKVLGDAGLPQTSIRGACASIGIPAKSGKTLIANLDVRRKYTDLGGIRSPLGLAVGPAYNALENALVTVDASGGYRADFRSGPITIENVTTAMPQAGPLWEAQVLLVGLECRVRQEKADEIFGSVGAVTITTHVSATTHFPDTGSNNTFEMGPEGERIISLATPAVTTEVANIGLICYLVEHDSGNVGVYR
ncbi:MAG TPA: hypothetical protein VIG37_23030 [Methylomirabilota bacterium]